MNLLSNKKLFIYIFTVFTIFTVNNAIGSDERTERKQGNLSGVNAGRDITQNYNEHRGGEGGRAEVHNHFTAPMTSPHLERERRPEEHFSIGESLIQRDPPNWAEAFNVFQFAATATPPHVMACVRCAEYYQDHGDLDTATTYYERALDGTGIIPQKVYGELMKAYYTTAEESTRKKTKVSNLLKAKEYGDKINRPTREQDSILDNIEDKIAQLGISESSATDERAPVIVKAVEPFEEFELSNARVAGLNLSPSLNTKSTQRVSAAKAEADRIIAEAEEEAEANRILAEAVAKAEQIKAEQIKAESDTKRLAAEKRVADAKIESDRASEAKMVARVPQIARGYEAVYNRFINGRLVYKGPAGERSFLISDSVNSSLEGEFNLSGLTYKSGSTTYNIDTYLRIRLGYRKSVENDSKVTVWLVPKFVVSGVESSFSTVEWTSDIGIFWTYGNDALSSLDYLTKMQFDGISSKNLCELAPSRRGCGGRLAPTDRGLWRGATFPLFLIKF